MSYFLYRFSCESVYTKVISSTLHGVINSISISAVSLIISVNTSFDLNCNFPYNIIARHRPITKTDKKIE